MVAHPDSSGPTGRSPPSRPRNSRAARTLRPARDCTQTRRSPSISCTSIPTAPPSATFASDERSTTRSTVSRIADNAADGVSRLPPVSRSPPACRATAATAPTRSTHAWTVHGAHRTWPGRGVSSAHPGRAESGSMSGGYRTPISCRGKPRPTSPPCSAPSAIAHIFILRPPQRSRLRCAAVTNCRSTVTGWPTTPAPPPTFRSSSAVAAATATATTATRRSIGRCSGPPSSNQPTPSGAA